MDSRCRLCGSTCVDFLSVFEDVDTPTRINKLFQVIICPEDTLPTSICYTCDEVVTTYWQFYDQVQKTQEVLLEVINTIHSPPVLDGELKTVDIQYITIPEHKTTDDIEVSEPKVVQCERAKPANDSDTWSNIDECERHEDGSITPQKNVESWLEYPWQCYSCTVPLCSADEVREHFASVHVQPPRYSCADCPKTYTKYSIFLSHVKLHRPQLKFCCDLCAKWFPTPREQEAHRSQHEDERQHCCLTCGKRFRMQSALMIHSRSHLPADVKNCHQCDQCPKRFGTKPNLMAHKRIHAGVREYTCDQCGKSFVQKGNLENHLLTHNQARPFICGTCGKAFKTVIRLKKHGSVHSGLKPHQCDVCGRQFRERGTLKEHHRIHTGAMPFTCEFCGKSFRFKGVLTTHRRQHTGERPYSCLECQHHFTNWPNYNKHMKRRHGINTSVTVRKPQSIPPTGMPQRNPPGSILAPPVAPQPVPDQVLDQSAFYPILGVYNLSDELLQQRL